jgi:hypothetical protein
MKLFATTAIPLAFCLIVAVVGGIGYLTANSPVTKQKRKDAAIGGVLLVTYCMLPTACLTVFQAFVCSEGVLAADQTVSCDSAEYTSIWLYAMVQVLIWPIGVPAAYLYMIGKYYGPSREQLKERIRNFTRGNFRGGGLADVKSELETAEEFMKLEAKAPKYLGVLNSEFEPQWWWMPVFEAYRKLSITGVTILLGSGTVDQLIAGMVVAIFAALV